MPIIFWFTFIPGFLLSSLWVFYVWIAARISKQERSKMVLDLAETGLKQGKNIDALIISVSETRDETLGVDFHLLAFYLKDGMPFREAVFKVPGLLSDQLAAMLSAGTRIGDIGKVIPACRHLSKDALSQTSGAINFLSLIVFLGFPINMAILSVLQVWVFPQFFTLVSAMEMPSPAGLLILKNYGTEILLLQGLLFLAVWVMNFLYSANKRPSPFFSKHFSRLSQWMIYRLSWRRKRLQRDFATMLAILIDAGMPEPEAVTLAADCTANYIIKERARRAVAGLSNGMKLADAVHIVEDAGEFRWRLIHAPHTTGGFSKAMAGWNESLDAKAFQEEQATAQVISTGIVLLNGVLVGCVVISAFSIIVAIINGAILW